MEWEKKNFSDDGLKILKDTITEDCLRIAENADDLAREWQATTDRAERQALLRRWADGLKDDADALLRTRAFILNTMKE